MDNKMQRFNDCMNMVLGNKKGCRALCDIPVDLLTIDKEYQTDERTERSLKKLIDNWDENKLEPITIVPHEEVGMFYIVNGYGRWTASQYLKEPKQYLSAIVLLGLSKEENKRRVQEAELYAYQNRECAKITPIQNHGALKIIGDPSVVLFEKLKNKYGFEFGFGRKTCKNPNTIGSYSEILNMIKARDEKCFDFIFSTLIACGFNKQVSGYSVDCIRSLRDIYDNYGNEKKVVDAVVSIFRGIAPNQFRAFAVARYPKLHVHSACSMYLEDEVCRIIGEHKVRHIENNKIVK